MNVPKPEKALRVVVGRVRSRPDETTDHHGPSITVPDEFRDADNKPNSSILSTAEATARQQLIASLEQDFRFEYLGADTEETVDHAICHAYFRRSDDVVSAFIAARERDIENHICLFPVELLIVRRPVTLFGATLMPADSASVPRLPFRPDPRIDSIISVPVCGTSRERMFERGRAAASRALRLWRAGLRDDHWVPDVQLRFRLGEMGWMDDGSAGWAAAPGTSATLELNEGLIVRAQQSAGADLDRPHASYSAEIRARSDLALVWWERAQLATDQVVRVLYLFTALEAILGDESEGLKSAGLALRRAVLGLDVSGGMAHPARIFLLYSQVRSAAVHGEEAPSIAEREEIAFAWDVRKAIGEFMKFAAARGLNKRSQVRRALDHHEKNDGLRTSLLEQDPKLWEALR